MTLERLPALMASAEWSRLPVRTMVVLVEALNRANEDGVVRLRDICGRLGLRTVRRAVADLERIEPAWVVRCNGLLAFVGPAMSGGRGSVGTAPSVLPLLEGEKRGEESLLSKEGVTEKTGAPERAAVGGAPRPDPLVELFYREVGGLLAVRRRTQVANENAYAQELRGELGEERSRAFLRFAAHHVFGRIYSIRVARSYRDEWDVYERPLSKVGPLREVRAPEGPVDVPERSVDSKADRKLDAAKVVLGQEMMPGAYGAWIEPLRAVESSAPYFRVMSPSNFAAGWVKEKYGERLGQLLGAEVLVEVGWAADVGASARGQSEAAERVGQILGSGGQGLLVGDGAESDGRTGVSEPASDEVPEG